MIHAMVWALKEWTGAKRKEMRIWNIRATIGEFQWLICSCLLKETMADQMEETAADQRQVLERLAEINQ